MRFLSCCCEKKKRRDIVLLLVGLDNAGKTTAVKGLTKQDTYNVLPTAGFSTVKLRHKGFNVSIYDLGGGPQIRDIWPRYFSDIHGVMFVIDASDMERLNESKVELKRLVLNEKISKKPILVLANKQDKPGALDEIDIIEKLSLEPLINAQKCPTRVEMCSFIQNQSSLKMDPGLLNGYRWLLGLIIKNYKELNERVERDSLSDRKAREQAREAWRRKKGLIKEIPIQSPFQVSPSLEHSFDGNITTIHSVVDNHLPPIAREENSSLETVIHNGTVEVMTHRPVKNPFVISDHKDVTSHPSSSDQSPKDTAVTQVSESSTSSTLPVRRQLEQKSIGQRQKSFSAHVRRSKRNNCEPSEPVKKITNQCAIFNLQSTSDTQSSLQEQSDGNLKSGNFIELPPVIPPGSSRPMTTRSLGRTGKAWDLHLPLDSSVPDSADFVDKSTIIF